MKFTAYAVQMHLDLYFSGLHIAVRSENAAVCERLARDFACQLAPTQPVTESIRILTICQAPSSQAPPARRLFRHFNGNVHGWGDQRWVQYEDALVFYNATTREGTVTSASLDLLHHYTYYLIIANAGIALDRRGLHRFHSLGVSLNGAAALFPMPISGGKTTLALALLEDPAVSLFSEDTPLIDRRGRVNAFPLRLSLRETQAANFPGKNLRRKLDPVFGVKFLLDLDYYGPHRICTEPGVKPTIFWGKKSSQQEPALAPMHPLRALALLLYYITLGIDCPQRAEIILRLTPAGLWQTAKILLSRTAAAIQLWRHSRSCWFLMSPDVARNAAFVKSWLAANASSNKRCN